MKIAVYGATGMVGSEVTAEALRRGHQVIAVTRRGDEVPGAVSLAGNLFDLEGLRIVAEQADAIVLSVAPDRSGNSHDEYIRAHQNIAAAEIAARVLIVGGAGALEVDGVQLKDLPDFPEAYKTEAETMSAILDFYRAASSLEWTMLAPAPAIGPGERTGKYILGSDSPAGAQISAADFAIAALDELEEPQHQNARFNAAS
nr:NAD(P)H-binding protein [Microbacterium halotolerans]